MSVAMIECLLFSPFRRRAINFPNRIAIAPMLMYKAAPDGLATDWHLQHLAKYAISGAGTVMTEALIVDPIGRNTYGDLGMWSDEHVAAPDRRFFETAGRVGGGAERSALGSACRAGPRHRGLIRKKRTSPWIFGWMDVSC
jgi:hypothetical protein